jgi:hypothetical protein
LIMADRLVLPAFGVEGDTEVVVGQFIVLRNFECVPEQGLTILPIPELLPRQRHAEDDHRRTRHRQCQRPVTPASDQPICAPDSEDEHPQRWQVSVTIRH